MYWAYYILAGLHFVLTGYSNSEMQRMNRNLVINAFIQCGPSSSTAISESSTAISSTISSSNPVLSTNKYLGFKVRLASIHYYVYEKY